MPMRRPCVGTRVSLKQLSRRPPTQVRAAPPPLTVATAPLSAALCVPDACGSDISALVRATCSDELFMASPAPVSGVRSGSSVSAGVLHTDNTVPRDVGRNLLNRLNSASWLSALPMLHARGALSESDEAGARRFLAGPTYQTLLPWLWETRQSCIEEPSALRNETYADGDGEAESAASLQDGIHRRLASLSALPRTVREAAPAAVHVDHLRTAPPEAWRAVASAWLPQTGVWPASTDGPAPQTDAEATLLERLPKWHQVFFALSANPALNGTASDLSAAHRSLLGVIALFYQDAVAIQTRVAPPLMSAVAGGDRHVHADTDSLGTMQPVVCSTRMPPILLRRLRRLYRAHGAYLLFSDVFRTCVEGEQEVLRIMSSRASELSRGAAPSLIPLYTTAVLQDAELFNFYLSIPGRRESNLPWEEQWRWTLSYADVAFRWLFRMQNLALHTAAAATDASTAHTGSGGGGAGRRHRRGRKEEDAVASTWSALQQAFSTLFNVTVWLRNNNGEGERCQQALQTVLDAYWDTTIAQPAILANDSDAVEGGVTHAQWQRTCTLMTALRKACWGSMHRKAEALQFAPSRGLLDVATLLAVLEAARPCSSAADADSFSPTAGHLRNWRQTLNTVLATRRGGVASAWAALCTSPSVPSPLHVSVTDAIVPPPALRQASRFALVTLGCRLLETVLTAARVQPSLGTAQRLLRELMMWSAQVGRPLRLSGGDLSALWLYQLHRRETTSGSSANAPPWSQTWHTLLGSLGGANAQDVAVLTSDAWTCGCGYANAALPDAAYAGLPVAPPSQRPQRSLACASCVNRDFHSFAWECTACHWANTTGEALYSCLRCSAPHPACATTLLPSPGADHLRPQHATNAVRACRHAHRVRVVAPLAIAAVEETISRETPLLKHADGSDGTPESVSCCVDCGEVRTTSSSSSSTSASLLLHCCPDCGSTAMALRPDTRSQLAEGTSAGPSTSSCAQCQSTRAYWRGMYTWHCGCGAANHPSHHHCWACTQDRADGLACYTCPGCQGEVTPLGDDAAVGSARCTHCGHPHPQMADAAVTARLAACPSCHSRMPADADACPHCRSTLVRLVRPLLETEADQPWICHGCGCTHTVRDTATGVLESSSFSPSRSAAPLDGHAPSPLSVSVTGEVSCAQCGIPRIPVAAWEAGRPWMCHCSASQDDDARDYSTHTGFHCPRCLQLAPGVPVKEVTLWSCARCGEWNPSWLATCGHFGCGAMQTESVRDRCAYVPWQCPACRVWSYARPGYQQCTHCHAAAPQPTLPSARAAGARALASRHPPSQHGDTLPGASRATASAHNSDDARQSLPPALALAEQRLDDVEAMLLQASLRVSSTSARKRTAHRDSTVSPMETESHLPTTSGTSASSVPTAARTSPAAVDQSVRDAAHESVALHSH